MNEKKTGITRPRPDGGVINTEKGTRNLQKHEMSFTYEALVCLGKQTALNFPLE